jgi:uncharacterized protein YbbC (DUF1343 family)
MPAPRIRSRFVWILAAVAAVAVIACMSAPPAEDATASTPGGLPRKPLPPRPGITMLLSDSFDLIAGKKVGLLTNQTGVNEKGVSDADLLVAAEKWPQAAGMQLVVLFSPEHGIRGTEDRMNVEDTKDSASGLPVISLYGRNVMPPPDSALDKIGVLLVDLQDIGARPWTYVASMVYAMRAAAQHHLPVVVLDRPNPINGESVEGPMLDSSLAYAGSQSPERPAQPTALYPIPLRHGMTMAELALFYNDALDLHADLHVVPMQGWRRSMWFDRTGFPWVNPSPNMTSLTAATLYPGVVLLEAANVSVGRGTPVPFQWVGAPWMDAKKVIDVLEDASIPGVKFSEERRRPMHPTDERYGGRDMDGIRITVTNRNLLQTSRLGAWLVWSIRKVHPDSFKVDSSGFAHLSGLPNAREQVRRGLDPDQIIDSTLPATVAFQQRVRRYRLYH